MQSEQMGVAASSPWGNIMAPDHQTSERVYRALKEDLLEGVLGLGRFAIPTLERRYNASATPVREALLRLVGERLVDLRSTGGFAAWQAEEIEARHLYEFEQRLLIAALGWQAPRQPVAERNSYESRLTPPVDALFRTLAESTRNSLMISTMESLNDRLHAFRRAEQHVLPKLDREFAALRKTLLGDGDRSARRLLVGYHQRRVRNILFILRAR
jgi:DNA-binding FadR family transcriptional regulator